MALTKRQRQVYDYIAGFVQKNGYSPSFEEIGEGMGLSSLATVHKHISNLEKKGLLRRDYNRSRSLDVLPPRGKLKQAAERAGGVRVSVAEGEAGSLPSLLRVACGPVVLARVANLGQRCVRGGCTRANTDHAVVCALVWRG